ncbi:MAG: hypothetical protein GXP08_12115 [Gammaproteobacteria bacterium]|nr:hypothetical protein [Gammaproteobacteria bacterium]
MKLFNKVKNITRPTKQQSPGVKLHLLAIFTLFVAFSSTAYTADSDKQTRERLLELKEQLELQTENMKQQRTSIKSMEQKLECTYSLLQSYNLCEENYEKNSEGYVSCMNKSKSDNSTCIGQNT